jgi:hypothetical protein
VAVAVFGLTGGTATPGVEIDGVRAALLTTGLVALGGMGLAALTLERRRRPVAEEEPYVAVGVTR